jgi:hypothetical protein
MYKNRVLEFADKYPLIAFFVVPIGMNLAGTFVHAMIRKNKTGSAWQGIAAGEDDDSVSNPLSGLGQVRTEGGDDMDMIFRAHANTGPATSGMSEYEAVQPRPVGTDVRYDVDYHDTRFLPSLDTSTNTGSVISQSRNANTEQSFVFAGMNGLSKINKW